MRVTMPVSPEWHGIKANFVDIVRRKAGAFLGVSLKKNGMTL